METDDIRRGVRQTIADELSEAARVAGFRLQDEIEIEHRIELPRRGPYVDRRDWFVRPDDLLVLRAYPVNLRVDTSTAIPTLARQGVGLMYLIVEFPPQHLNEEAFFQTAAGYALVSPTGHDGKSLTNPEPDPDVAAGTDDETPTDDTPPVQSIIAGMSRVVLRVTDTHLPIPWTLNGILDALRDLRLSVTNNALPPTQRRFPDWFLGKVLRTGIPAHTRVQAIEAIKQTLIGSRTQTQIAIEATVAPPAPTSALQVAGAARARRAVRITDNALGLSTITGVATRDLDTRVVGGLLEPIDELEIDHPFEFRAEPREPTTTQTAIEAPYQLFLSPTTDGTWFHETNSRTSTETGHTELWHTRLGTVVPNSGRLDGANPRRVVRAVWTTDGPPEVTTPPPGQAVPLAAHVDFPYRTPLDGFDRHSFVHLSSNFALEDADGENWFEPPAIDVDLLMLSALGSWLDTRGAWEVPQPRGLSVEEWRHRATLGRDHYVRVVYTGCLLPFGHRASLIKISERQFHEQLRGNPAYLRQRMFLVVRQPLRTYRHSGLKFEASGDRKDESFDRMMPFDAVRITTRVSPLLDQPTSDTVQPSEMSKFWPRVAGQPFKFHVIATDTTGNETHLAMPMIFVGKEVTDATYAAGDIDQIAAHYEDPAHGRSTVQAGGQKIAMAEQGAPDDTSSTVRRLTFGAELPSETTYNTMDWREPRFVPVVRSAAIDVPSMQRIAGTNEPAEVVLAHRYLVDGFGTANPGQLFLAAKPGATKLAVAFSKQGDRSGALLTPDLSLSGISRITGPISGKLDDAADGSFKPADWFGAITGAKLFGAFSLGEVLEAAGLEDLTKIPRFAGQSLNVVEQLISGLDLLRTELAAAGGAGDASVQAVRTRLTQLIDPATGILARIVQPGDTPAQRDARVADVLAALVSLQAEVGALAAALPGGGGLPPNTLTLVRARVDAVAAVVDRVVTASDVLTAFVVGDELPESVDARFDWRPQLKATSIFKPADLRSLVLSVAIAGKLEGAGDERVTVTASLENFTLDLTFVIISFEHLQFRVRDGKKPEIDVAMKNFGFGGPLSFVNTLREIIPLDGFSDPPDVKVTAEGITAGFAVGLPNIAVGVFSLENLAISAGFTVPFVGPPMSAYFNFCERQDPARLTVTLFGGGFFFGVTVNADGLFLVEAAIEFGAAISVDFGVASGSVSVMAGIYFAMKGSDAHLTGYFRMRGEVEALGIVSVSIELYLELSYETSTGKAIGTASLTLEISVAMFSTSITITQSKKFAGGNADPTFAELVEAVDDPALGVVSDDWDTYCRSFA